MSSKEARRLKWGQRGRHCQKRSWLLFQKGKKALAPHTKEDVVLSRTQTKKHVKPTLPLIWGRVAIPIPWPRSLQCCKSLRKPKQVSYMLTWTLIWKMYFPKLLRVPLFHISANIFKYDLREEKRILTSCSTFSISHVACEKPALPTWERTRGKRIIVLSFILLSSYNIMNILPTHESSHCWQGDIKEQKR